MSEERGDSCSENTALDRDSALREMSRRGVEIVGLRAELARLRAELKKFREFNNYEATAHALEAAEAKVALEHENFLIAHRDNMKAALRIADLTKERDEAISEIGAWSSKCGTLAAKLAEMEAVVEAYVRAVLLARKDESGKNLLAMDDSFDALSRLTAPEGKPCENPGCQMGRVQCPDEFGNQTGESYPCDDCCPPSPGKGE